MSVTNLKACYTIISAKYFARLIRENLYSLLKVCRYIYGILFCIQQEPIEINIGEPIAKLSIADVYIKPKEVEGLLYFYLCEQKYKHSLQCTSLSARFLLSTRSGLSDLIYSTACLPDLQLVYVPTSLSARSGLLRCLADLHYLPCITSLVRYAMIKKCLPQRGPVLAATLKCRLKIQLNTIRGNRTDH